MELHGSSSGVFDIKSPADGYVNYFISETPEQFERALLPIEHRIRLESKDLERRRLTMTMHGNWVYESCKTVKATITVTPKEHSEGSRLAWTVEFEKIRHDIGDPKEIVDYLVMYFEKIDFKFHVRCVLDGKVDFINVESQADKCFKDFIDAFKDDANVEIETVEWENRTSTMRMSKYKTLKVTTTITPSDDGSRVAWTIKSDKFANDPDLSTNTVLYLREMIHDKLLQ